VKTPQLQTAARDTTRVLQPPDSLTQLPLTSSLISNSGEPSFITRWCYKSQRTGGGTPTQDVLQPARLWRLRAPSLRDSSTWTARSSNPIMPDVRARFCNYQWVLQKDVIPGTCDGCSTCASTNRAQWRTCTSKSSADANVLRALTSADGLDDIDILEPDPRNHRQAMRHPRLAPFWKESGAEEMTGLFRRGCFKKHRVSDLTPEQRKHIFGSRFHHKIKRHTKTGIIKSLKIRLVVMGNNMTKGEDFTDAFAPVPRATAGRILMSMAAAEDMEMHCVDFSQAFIQASWDDLPEDVPQIFIRPPVGYDEEPGVVYEVLRPLYGIPSSARALHFTRILMSAHIDDTLILCQDRILGLRSYPRSSCRHPLAPPRHIHSPNPRYSRYAGCEPSQDPARAWSALVHEGFT